MIDAFVRDAQRSGNVVTEFYLQYTEIYGCLGSGKIASAEKLGASIK